MLRYDLDRLGWFEFESLVQAILKSKLGLGVEAWGGSSDGGRDAAFTGTLMYPASTPSTGHFIFQCKFVSGANAAGANSRDAVRKAVRAEITKIKVRRERGAWPAATHYVLLTNAPLPVGDRHWISEQIAEAIPGTSVHLHDGQDLCGWLDNAGTVARAFPQLLGLRDLEALLAQWVNKEVLERSDIAIADARALAEVFVPTGPYSQALSVVSQHHFVVLEGPPEMGKTAIARMMGLTQLSRGWDVFECRSPEDFFKTYKKERSQVFIADDFFGRTEYDPSRISRWQDDLPYILRRLDSSHWFALTTRAHLLNLARSKLDVAGFQHRFPSIGEVLVDASLLSKMDKARMVYRHCKVVGLSDLVRNHVKRLASDIVANRHFTPERIRRLVNDVLRSPAAAKFSSKQFDKRVQEELANPTKGMSISFAALPEAHKWMLFALLENDQTTTWHFRQGENPSLVHLKRRFERLCPEQDQIPVERVANELSEAFVRAPKGVAARTVRRTELDWIHPSVRDLAVNELSAMPRYRKAFLRTCGTEGIQLACSVGGDAFGQRAFPLLIDDDDWLLFQQRLPQLILEDPELLSVLSWTMDAAGKQSAIKDKLARLKQAFTEVAVPAYVDAMDQKHGWSPENIRRFLRALPRNTKLKVFPQLFDMWMKEAVRLSNAPIIDSMDTIRGVVEVIRAGDDLVEREIAQVAPSGQILETLVRRVVQDASIRYDYLDSADGESYSDLSSDIDTLDELIGALSSFVDLEQCPEELRNELLFHVNRLEELKAHLEEFHQEGDSDEDDSGHRGIDDVSIPDLFRDL